MQCSYHVGRQSVSRHGTLLDDSSLCFDSDPAKTLMARRTASRKVRIWGQSIRDLSDRILQVPFYRQPNTIGWPFMEAAIPPVDPTARSIPFDAPRCLLCLLPNFMPKAVQALLCAHRDPSQPFWCSSSVFSFLLSTGSGQALADMDTPYDWPLECGIFP